MPDDDDGGDDEQGEGMLVPLKQEQPACPACQRPLSGICFWSTQASTFLPSTSGGMSSLWGVKLKAVFGQPAETVSGILPIVRCHALQIQISFGHI